MLDAAAHTAGTLLGLDGPLVFPGLLLRLITEGTELVELDASTLSAGPLAFPGSEFGLLGTDMPDYYDRYEFAEYMPGAWPIALDGSGGFFCLDLREIVIGRAPNDGNAPVVWSHAADLGWDADEVIAMGSTLDEFLESTHAAPI